MGVPPNENPGVDSAGIQTLVLRFGLVATAVIGWKGASQVWEAGNTVSNTASLVLMLVTCLASFALLVFSSFRRPPAGAALLIPVALLFVFLDYSQTHSVHQFTNGTLVTTDVLVYNDYAARLIRAGENPYLHDLRPGHEVFRANLEYSTPLLDAGIASKLVYPALGPLLFVPFQLLGLSTQAVFPLFFLLATAVLFWASPEDLRPVVLLPLFAEQRYLQYSFGGVSDIVWAFLLLLMIVTWKRPLWRGIWYGLACAYKQHPWLLAPFLLVRIWRETTGTTSDKVRKTLLFSGVSAGVFLVVNAPFIVSSPKIWLASIFQPLTTPMIAFGQGLTSLGVTGLLILPKPALTVLMLSALGTLLYVYSRHFPYLRTLMWIAPGIAMWFGNRSLSSYWYFFALPLLLEIVRNHTILPSPKEEAEKKHLWPTAAVVATFMVLLISVVLWGGLQAPALEVSIRPPLNTDGQWVHQMTLEVVNRSDFPVQARVAVQSWTNQPFFWVIEKGPEVILPRQRAHFVVKADAPFQRFRMQHGAGVTVSDSRKPHIRGFARVRPDPNQAYPAVIDNASFDYWDTDGLEPIGWRPEILPRGQGSVEPTRLDDGRDCLRFSISKIEDDVYGWARLKTTMLFPDDPILFTVRVPQAANIRSNQNIWYGAELGCYGENVTVVFGTEEGPLEWEESQMLWGIPAPREEWAEVELDVWKIFEGLGIDTTPARTRDRVVDQVDFPTAPLSVSLFMAARNQDKETAGFFGPVRSSRLRPDQNQVFHRTIDSPERWMLWRADHSFQNRNYEAAAEDFRKAAAFPGLTSIANHGMEKALSKIRRRDAVTEKGRSSDAPWEYSNVLLIVIDTLRADHLGVYGGETETPHIDQLAGSGVLFEKAYSHIPITGPSHSSLFTSVLPPEHGVRNNAQHLSNRHSTLAETLLDVGFDTAAFVSLGVLQGKFGFSRGFLKYEDRFGRDWMKNAEEVNRLVLPWLQEWDGSPYFLWVHYSDPHEPYSPPGLLYSRIRLVQRGVEIGRLEADGRGNKVEVLLQPGPNLIQVESIGAKPEHGFFFSRLAVGAGGPDLTLLDGWQVRERDSAPPAIGSTLPASFEVTNSSPYSKSVEIHVAAKERLSLEQIRKRYRQEVEYVDTQVGLLMAALERQGMLEDTLIVLTADHGEGLGEHNHVGHISQLYEPAIHVPLMMSFPGHIEPGTLVTHSVGFVDVFPTINELLELPAPENVSGRSLVPLIRGIEKPRAVLAATYRPEAPVEKNALLMENFKYIWSLSDHVSEELYDLETDPSESSDLTKDRPELVAKFRNQLESRLEKLAHGNGLESEKVQLSESDKEQLRALGYIH